MKKNIHAVDALFKKAQNNFTEQASAGSWEKIKAELDARDIRKYKKKLANYKGFAVMLLLLLGTLSLYESGIISGKDHPGKNKMAEPDKNKMSYQPENPVKEFHRVSNKFQNKISLPLPQKDLVNNTTFTNAARVDLNLIPVSSLRKTNTNLLAKIPEQISGDLSIKTIIPTGQNIQQKEKRKSTTFTSWSISPFAAGTRAGYILDNDGPPGTTNGNNDISSQIRGREHHDASLSVGILVSKQLTKHLIIQSGAIYTNTVISISPQELYATAQSGKPSFKYVVSSGYGFINPPFTPVSIGDSIESTETEHKLQVLSLPLQIGYLIRKEKWSAMGAAGLTGNYIASANLKTEVYNASGKQSVQIGRLEGMNRFYAGAIGELKIGYDINKKWSANLLGFFHVAITPITKNNVVETYPYSFSSGISVTYGF